MSTLFCLVRQTKIEMSEKYNMFEIFISCFWRVECILDHGILIKRLLTGRNDTLRLFFYQLSAVHPASQHSIKPLPTM